MLPFGNRLCIGDDLRDRGSVGVLIIRQNDWEPINHVSDFCVKSIVRNGEVHDHVAEDRLAQCRGISRARAAAV